MDSCSEASLAAATPTWASLIEASGDSDESDEVLDPGAASIRHFDDDGDAESCSGGDDDHDGSEELGVFSESSRRGSWRCWMTETAGAAVVGGTGCPPPLSATEVEARDAEEGDRLFWEACIAHGY